MICRGYRCCWCCCGDRTLDPGDTFQSRALSLICLNVIDRTRHHPGYYVYIVSKQQTFALFCLSAQTTLDHNTTNSLLLSGSVENFFLFDFSD